MEGGNGGLGKHPEKANSHRHSSPVQQCQELAPPYHPREVLRFVSDLTHKAHSDSTDQMLYLGTRGLVSSLLLLVPQRLEG